MVLRGQFTYTACQAPGPYSAVPGWKVKQAVPVEAGQELAQSVIQSAVRPFGGFKLPAIPALVTQAEVEHLPRCLRLDVLDDDFRSVAHLAVAGRDHSGRDAFFAHGLLVELTPHGLPLDPAQVRARQGLPRPADLWGADGWLTPFRAEAIETAVVQGLPTLSAASPMDPERREDFIDLHPGQRAFVFAAVERALRDGAPLVVVGLPVEASMWVSLATHFMLPSAAWSFPFSTYERTLPQAVLDGGLLLVGVPDDDYGTWRAVSDKSVTVLAPMLPDFRRPDAPDRGYPLHGGGSLRSGSWAQLAELVCARDLEDRVRAQLDRLGDELGAGADSSPLWGLGAAVLLADPPIDDPVLARLAVDVVTRYFPVTARLTADELRPLIAAVARTGGPDSAARIADVLRTISEAGARDQVVYAWTAEYLFALLGSRGCFTRDQLPWLPNRWVAPATGEELPRRLPELVSWIDTEVDPVVQGRLFVTVSRIAGLCHRSEPEQQQLVAPLIDRARSCLVSLLTDGVPLTAAGWPRLPDWLWLDVISEAFAHTLAHQEPGELAIRPAVALALSQAGGPLPESFTPGETIARLTVLDGERAAAVLAGGEVSGTSARNQRELILRSAAFLRTILVAEGVTPDCAIDEELRRWFPGSPPTPEFLTDLIVQIRDRFPDFDPLQVVDEALRVTPPSPATAALVRAVQDLPRARAGTPALVPSSLMQWHRQLGLRMPRSARVPPGTGPASRPDHVEQSLLEAVVTDRLPTAMMPVARLRLGRWMLLQMAITFVEPRPEIAQNLNVPTPLPLWIIKAGLEPFRTSLQPEYRTAATQLVRELTHPNGNHERESLELAAQWLIRAVLVESAPGNDPAAPFFSWLSAGGMNWKRAARDLLQPLGRQREARRTWLRLVREAADLTIAAAGAGRIEPGFLGRAEQCADALLADRERPTTQ